MSGLTPAFWISFPRSLTPRTSRRDLRRKSRLQEQARPGRPGKRLKAEPHAFFVPEDARLVTCGNLEDHLHCLAEADWIIEVVVEDLEAKRRLMRRVETSRRPGSVVSTNTSGLSVNRIAAGFSR